MNKYKFSIVYKNGLTGTQTVIAENLEEATSQLSGRGDIEKYTYIR